jgi:protein translocase SecG subunit
MKYLSIIQIISAVLLIVAILFQSRGAGVSGVFGGEGAVYQTKRGAEKILFVLTIILSIIFLGTALLSVVL